MQPLIFVSLLSANAEPLYRALAAYLTARLGLPVQTVEDRPWQERRQMLLAGQADLAAICGEPYVLFADQPAPPVSLLAAPVLREPRYGGRPAYFSDVIVRHDAAARSFAELRGARWAYNELGSFSGYHVVLAHLRELGLDEGFFGATTFSGAHLESLRIVLAGEVDATAIDSIVLAYELHRRPELAAQLRVVAAIGPSPSPPLVVARHVSGPLAAELRSAILAMQGDPLGQAALEVGLLSHYSAVSDADYNPIRQRLRAVGI
jgi:phosphonate transport system substrate-binding protein